MYGLDWNNKSIGWIVKDSRGKLSYVRCRGFIPEGAVCEAPKDEEGRYIKDTSIITIRKVRGVPTAKLKKGVVYKYEKPNDLDKYMNLDDKAKTSDKKLPNVADFLEAYLEERDGNPLKMQQMIKEYVLAKRGKK